MTSARIVVLGGDGIGPEVTEAALHVLGVAAKRGGKSFETRDELLGGIAIDATGEAMPERTREACVAADAVLLGAVGGPKWDDPRAKTRPEAGLLGLRKAMGVFANLRPVRLHAALADASPLRRDRIEGADMVFVRELTGGLYFGTPKGRAVENGVERAFDTLVYDQKEIERVVDLAFRLAAPRKKKVTSVDKANVLESSRLWREVAVKVASRHAGIALEHQLVDSCAMKLLTHAKDFDVIVTENMFGDILTDEAAALAGSLGLLPSASLGEGPRGLYEPIHGSAPDIAGKGLANPVGAILSAAMLARHSLGWTDEAAAIERGVDAAIAKGARTRDLGGTLGTREMTNAVVDAMQGGGA
ncbi:3-isopropylmalate dehydrogenase [Sandaracinus amylolyticus]|uniref:3-isopropylmalate dehydrogenase n=1 Tax=Sandaracinus amylolyticus TaxID=927083 RepID=UPI001F00BEEF|nr:3-isopropylmalate dehydrogenase [Sandaracinus amylolyticus]UJR79333.1 Isopropylmalate dehydrogenase [Sandaracinus amylolyticus]